MERVLLVDRVGFFVLGALESVGALATFGTRALVESVRPPYEPAEILRHLYQFGLRSMPLVPDGLLELAEGDMAPLATEVIGSFLESARLLGRRTAELHIALASDPDDPDFAPEPWRGRILETLEAEIGAMKVTEQIDALEANAVDAFKFLTVTRVIACMIAMPLLTTLMSFAGIFGGYVAEAAVSGMPWRLYFERAFTFIAFSDLIPATLKTIVFGYLIAIVGCYLGFTATRGTEGVGEASTRSVVMSSILIILSDVILVKIIFFFYPQVPA